MSSPVRARAARARAAFLADLLAAASLGEDILGLGLGLGLGVSLGLGLL